MSLYARRHVFLDSASANSSTYTSNPYFVGDFRQMTVEWPDGGNSRLTLDGSNDDGFNTSIASWSAITGITGAGIFTVDPGMRWMRARRWSGDSLAAVVLQGRR